MRATTADLRNARRGPGRLIRILAGALSLAIAGGLSGGPASAADSDRAVQRASEPPALQAQLAQAQLAQAQLAQAQPPVLVLPPPAAAAAPPGDPFAAEQALVQQLLRSTEGERPPQALVESLYDDPADARRPMAIFLSDGPPAPGERARRAVILARGILDSRRAIAEPETRDALIRILLEVASEVVCSARFVRSDVVEGYVPRLSTHPFDFGGPASQLASGFTLATPLSGMFVGGQPVDLEGLGSGALLFDGIAGIDRIVLRVPNGRYILILLTAVGGQGEVFRVRVNGMDHWIAWTPARDWPLGAPLLVPAGLSPARVPVGGVAGKLSLPLRVADGTASIDFDALPGGLPFASLELVLFDEDVGPDLDEEDCLRWDRAQREAIRALLEDGGRDRDPPVLPPTDGGCIAGACPIDDPDDPSPSGAT